MEPRRPLRDEHPEAGPFRFEGRGQAALLIHGLTGTPAQLKGIGAEISRSLGWEVRAPLLPGHGTTVEDLSRTTAEDWIRSVDEAVTCLSGTFSRIHLLGLSMGASLCLQAYRETPGRIASLVLLAPTLWLRSWRENLLAQAACALPVPRRWEVWPKTGTPPSGYVGYDSLSAPSVGQFLRLTRRVRSFPVSAGIPALTVYSESDETAHPKSGRFLAKRLTHPRSKCVALVRAGHVLTLTEEKERVTSEVLSFYRGITSPS